MDFNFSVFFLIFIPLFPYKRFVFRCQVFLDFDFNCWCFGNEIRYDCVRSFCFVCLCLSKKKLQKKNRSGSFFHYFNAWRSKSLDVSISWKTVAEPLSFWSGFPALKFTSLHEGKPLKNPIKNCNWKVRNFVIKKIKKGNSSKNFPQFLIRFFYFAFQCKRETKF